MQLILEAEKQEWQADETVVVRLLALNDEYEPAIVDRRLLVGPNPIPGEGRMPPPISLEPAFASEEQNRIALNPWSFYGRQRSFSGLPVGQVVFYGYLLGQPTRALLPQAPADAAVPRVEAESLVLTVR